MTNSDLILKALLNARIDAFKEIKLALDQVDNLEQLRKRLDIDIEATGNVLEKI